MASNAIFAVIFTMSIIGGLGFGATMDLDNDGIANMEDPDDDGDGIVDTEDEFPHDHDNDAIPDRRDDDDNDEIPDAEDDEYVGNCSRPDEKPGKGFRKFHLRHQNRSENRTLLEEMGYRL